MLLVAATPRAYTNNAALWDQGVFPDDLTWTSHYKLKQIENEKNVKEEVEPKKNVCQTQECITVGTFFMYLKNCYKNIFLIILHS